MTSYNEDAKHLISELFSASTWTGHGADWRASQEALDAAKRLETGETQIVPTGLLSFTRKDLIEMFKLIHGLSAEAAYLGGGGLTSKEELLQMGRWQAKLGINMQDIDPKTSVQYSDFITEAEELPTVVTLHVIFNGSGEDTPYIELARKIGARIVFVDGGSSTPVHFVLGRPFEVVTVSFRNPEEVAKALE